MPRAAVPEYLGSSFPEASPGLRFSMLLPIWTDRRDQEEEVRERARRKSREGVEAAGWLEDGIDTAVEKLTKQNKIPRCWDRSKSGARDAWRSISELGAGDRQRLAALSQRQEAMAARTSGVLRLDAMATAPFTTGLGIEHPLENGFAFLNPYGLPYLPGSGVKGVLRRAAAELASGEWGGSGGWSTTERYRVRGGAGVPGLELSVIDVLFGVEPAGGDDPPVRGTVWFWDVIPQIRERRLMVEVMTPHQTHYYQPRSGHSASPHDSGDPNPITFLTVPPGSAFTFFLVCDERRLHRLAPELLQAGLSGLCRWQELLVAACEHAFEWLGFGAKTSVGYGALVRDPAAEGNAARRRQAVQESAERERLRKSMSPQRQQVESFVDYARQELQKSGRRKTRIGEVDYAKARQLAREAAGEDWSAADRVAAADAIEHWLPQLVDADVKVLRKKLELGRLRPST